MNFIKTHDFSKRSQMCYTMLYTILKNDSLTALTTLYNIYYLLEQKFVFLKDGWIINIPFIEGWPMKASIPKGILLMQSSLVPG